MSVDPRMIHGHIIDCMQALGYQSDDKGGCFGLSNMAMVSAMQNKSDEFNNRLEALRHIDSKVIKAQMDDAHTARLSGNATSEQLALLEIIPFFDAVEVGFDASEFPQLFEEDKKPAVQDFMASMSIIAPLGFDENALIASEKIIGNYNEARLTQYLTTLHQLLNDATSPVGLSLVSGDHCITITHIPDVGWQINGAGFTRTIDFGEEDKLCHAIFNEFYNYQISDKVPTALKPAIFASQFYLRENDKQLLEPKIHQWKRQTVDNKTHINSELIQEQDFRGFSLLEIAVKSGFLLELNILIEAGIDVNQTFTDQQITLLYAAVERDYSVDTVNALIKAGADVNKAVIGREPPLACALRRNNIDVVNALIKAGAEVNKPIMYGETPLNWTLMTNNIVMMAALIKGNADINQPSKKGITPLSIAIENNNIEMINALIEAGAEINKANNNGDTPLHTAVSKGNLNAINTLLRKDAKINKENNYGETPLHIAISKGNLDVINVLLNKGADINAKNEEGETPLHLAAFYGNADTVNVLIAAGAEVNKGNEQGDTALHISAKAGNLDVINALLRQGAEVDKKNDYGDTPLHVVELYRSMDVIYALIEAEADVNAANSQGETLLHMAARYQNIDVINALVAAGANIDKMNAEDETPADIAASSGDLDVINALLSIAVKNGNIAAVKTLLEAGADVNKRRKGGRRLLRKAILKQHLEIADLLIASGARGSLVMEDSDGFSLLEGDLIDNNIERARFLIKHGQTVELDAKYNKRETILERAIRKGHTEVVQLFINNFIEEPSDLNRLLDYASNQNRISLEVIDLIQRKINENLDPVIVLGRPFPADLVAGYNQGRSLLEKFEFKATMMVDAGKCFADIEQALRQGYFENTGHEYRGESQNEVMDIASEELDDIPVIPQNTRS